MRTDSQSHNTTERAYVLYANESYFDIVSTCAKSIRKFSNYPIYVYLLNSDLKVNVPNTTTINWSCDLDPDTSGMYKQENNNFFINRSNSKIYNLLIQRPLITKDVLEKYAKVVAYVDSDSIATQYVDRIFDMYDETSDYPYFVEGIYDYLHINGRGGADSRDDLSTTLEHPSCELFNVNQYVRERYRQTGYYVSGQKTIPFLEEWYWMCINPKVLKDFEFYAPYHEETILNVLLWKYNIMNGLPYIYVNGGTEIIKKIKNDNSLYGKHIGNWVRVPDSRKDILFYHGEKRINEMESMIHLLIENNKNSKINILFLAPHLSTGGMPSYLLKRIQELVKFSDKLELFVVEYSDFSPVYVVQKNKIKQLIKPSNFWTLGSNKNQLIDIIKNNNIDIVHVDEVLEGFESFNQISSELLDKLYDNNRTWKIVETCHNVWFDPKTMLKYNPDAFSFCTPWHKINTFKDIPSYSEVMEFPIDNNRVSDEEKIKTRIKLGFDLNRKHVVNVGLWTSGKNQGEAVEVARLTPEIDFHFVGNQAPNFKEYWGPIMKNLPPNVKIWGERDDVDLFLKSADVFMFNSTWECNPLVLREAASYGLKIMSRNLPQYVGMFDKYITEITNDDTTLTIKDKLISLINSGINTIELTNQSENFGKQFLNFYQKVNGFEPKIQEKMNNINIVQHFVNQPFLEILGDSDKLYTIKFFDDKGNLQYENKLKPNHWVKLNKIYFIKWRTQVWEGDKLIYENHLNLEGKRVYISIESKSLGDSIAWIPYALEFKNKHNCEVIVSTFWNKLFKDVYPELTFSTPGVAVHNLYAMYRIGWFYNSDMEPVKPNTIRLQEAASNILGLEFKEIKPRLKFTPRGNPFKEKYVTIANESTSGLKYWNNPNGWQELVDYLNSKGYKVINVSKNGDPLKGVSKIKDTSIENTMNVIHHSEFFIGLSSGLSWLSWALNKQVVMISNFTKEDHEFVSDCVRITNPSVCNGCWNNPNFLFDKGDWFWCPEHKNTPRHFECHRSITSQMVIDKIEEFVFLEPKKVKKFETEFKVFESEKWSKNFWRNRFSTWEDKTFIFIDKFLDKEKTFIDIGSWIGPMSLYASFNSKKCISFEPDKIAHSEFSKNIEINNIQNIVLEKKAVSLYKTLTLGSKTELGHSVTRENVSDNSFTIECVNINDILTTYNLNKDNISLIKIDIEGHESELLKDETLMELNVPMHISFHPGFKTDKNKFFNDVKPFLIKKGFDIEKYPHNKDFFEIEIE